MCGRTQINKQTKGLTIINNLFGVETVRPTLLGHTLTVFVHCCDEALIQPTSAALISMSFVNGASTFEITLSLARVHSVPVYASFEESRTTLNIDKIDIGFSYYCPFDSRYSITLLTHRHSCISRSVFPRICRRKLYTECPASDRLKYKNRN